MSKRYMIVGLGNPGSEYDSTRHNIGFQCIDTLAQKHGLAFEHKKQSKAKIAMGTIERQSVLLVKPQTYMNLSGSAVQGLAAYYRIAPEDILVVFDDLDIPPGTLRIRAKGGTGGHKGMTDIVQRLGTQNIPRIRFGIGRPPGQMDPAAFVLRRFDADEHPVITEAVDRACHAIETWLTRDINTAMNLYNGSAAEVATRFAPPHTPEANPTQAPDAQDT